MESGQVIDLVVFIGCCVAFGLYHVWYFLLRGTLLVPGMTAHINLWNTSLKTRSLWSDLMMADAKEAITAVQTVRNMIIAVSLLAAAEATLIAQMLQILTDPQRIRQVEHYSLSDPISGGAPLMSAEVKVALAMGDLFISLLIFAQSVRLGVHLGFLIRVVPAHPHIGLPLRDETIILMQRSSLYFTIGLRLLYFFAPLAFYMTLGSLALLIATAVLLVALVLLDTVPARHMSHLMQASTTTALESTGNAAATPAPGSFAMSPVPVPSPAEPTWAQQGPSMADGGVTPLAVPRFALCCMWTPPPAGLGGA